MMAETVRKSRERGFVLVATSLAALFLLGAAGLAVDIGRMYVARSETQSFVDSASLAAAAQLDDTTAGVTRALNAVSNNPKRWQFGNSAFTDVQTVMATSSSGPWLAGGSLPSPPTGYYYAQVTATVNPRLYLMGLLAGSSASTIRAQAAAGRVNRPYFTEGIFPFSPYSHKIAPDCATCDDASDLFGMRIGNRYTLRWAADPTLAKENVCSGDDSQTMIDISNAGGGSIRGYIELNSAADLSQAILSNVTTDLSVSGSADVPTNFTLDSTVDMDGGAKNSVINLALATRVGQDSDPLSETYAAYKSSRSGNGRRMVVVPINNGAPDFAIAGFAGFFLLTPSSYDVTGNLPACAEYVGAWTQGNPYSGGATIHNTGDLKFMVRLTQ
jgi:Flp pilus assembly protein TadG